MKFINKEFMLHSDAARRLYREYAQDQPILDYHNHLPPKDIATNRQFANLFEIWLEGDHYKWRAMRANGSDERYCTGDAEPYEKFLAWAKTVPHTLRNPLYHWTHLELKRYFGIDELLSEKTAPKIWEQANALLATPAYTTHGILHKFNVAALCTTDDPADELTHHIAIAKLGIPTKVYPTFRPDKALNVDKPALLNEWLGRLEAASGVSIAKLPDLLDALDKRHQAFHDVGGRLSDHGLTACYADFPTEAAAAKIFDAARAGKAANPVQFGQFVSYMMVYFGKLDTKRGWTKQLHLGPIRNNNSKMFAKLGPDTGFDSIGDYKQAETLSAYLDRLCKEDALPKTIVYNNNPVDNYVLSTMVGNFQDGITPGKMQFGSGWWYLDAKEGIEWQLNALSNNGLLSRFVGMLTDSRSFMSYPRHEYFRRILCNVIGREIELGEIPNDDSLVGPMISNICYHNAKNYLALGE
ncbi:MAG TPA: glucuronate isomerase [Capsulimonadaceae bacterium]